LTRLPPGPVRDSGCDRRSLSKGGCRSSWPTPGGWQNCRPPGLTEIVFVRRQAGGGCNHPGRDPAPARRRHQCQRTDDRGRRMRFRGIQNSQGGYLPHPSCHSFLIRDHKSIGDLVGVERLSIFQQGQNKPLVSECGVDFGERNDHAIPVGRLDQEGCRQTFSFYGIAKANARLWHRQSQRPLFRARLAVLRLRTYWKYRRVRRNGDMRQALDLSP